MLFPSEVYFLALAIAKVNNHPDPETWAEAVAQQMQSPEPAQATQADVHQQAQQEG